MAGLIGAVVHLMVSIPVQLVAGPIQMRMMQRLMERAAAENPDLGRMADQMQYGAAHGIFALIMGFVFFLVGTAFATLGGMLGALFFKKDSRRSRRRHRWCRRSIRRRSTRRRCSREEPVGPFGWGRLRRRAASRQGPFGRSGYDRKTVGVRVSGAAPPVTVNLTSYVPGGIDASGIWPTC